VNTHSYRAKDGTLITGIPDDVGDNDPRLFDFYKQMKSAGQSTAQFGQLQLTPEQAAAVDPESAGYVPPVAAPAGRVTDLVMHETRPAGVVGDTMQGIAQGTQALGRGMVKGAMSVPTMVADPVTVLINKILPPEYQQLPPSEGLNIILKGLGVPESETKTQEILEAVGMGLGSAAAGVGTGAAMAAGAPALGMGNFMQETGKALASGPVQQLLGGAGSSVASTVAAQKGAGPLAQFGAGLAGGVAGSAAGNALNLMPADVNPMQSTVDASGKLRTQLMTSDVIPPKTFAAKTGQALGEKIPVVGTGPVRAAQQADRIADVKDLLRQFGADDAAAASDDVMRDVIAKRAGNFKRWEGMKQEALQSVEDAKPGATVPMTKTVKSIDDSIAYLKSLNNAEVEPAIAKLLNWKGAVQNQTPVNVLTNKQMLGDIFEAPELGSVKKVMAKELKKTYDAVKNDLSDFIGEAGGEQAKNKWGIANKEETKLFKELELGILESTLEKGVDRPEVVKNMLFNKDKSVIQALNKNLTAKGRESARAAIMQEVGKKIGDEASPEKFLSEMRKLKNGGDPVGVFFTGDDLKAIEGLTRVLKATTRASQAALNPPTGVQAVIPLSIIGMGGGSVALEKLYGQGLPGLLASIGLVGAAGGGARLYESPTVRNILMKLPTVRPGSVEEGALFKRLLEASQAVKPKKDETNER